MRKELDIMNLEDIIKGLPDARDSMQEGNPLRKQQVYIDFDAVQEEMNLHATEVVDSYVDFWIMDQNLKDGSMIQNKRRMDILNLSDMLFSVYSSMYSLKKVLSEIDTGNINPRLIDTQTSLLNKKKDYNNQLALFQVYLNDSYKAHKGQYETMIQTEGDRMLPSARPKGESQHAEVLGEVNRGHKELILKMRQ